MTRLRLKPTLFRLHRWLGLALAPLFLLILVSGAVLAVKPMVQSPQTGIAPAVAAAILERVDPTGEAAMVAADGATLRLDSRGTGPKGTVTVPAGDWITTQSSFDLFGLAQRLHKDLLVGAGIVVELAAYAMVVIIVTGPFLAPLRLRNTLMGWHRAIGWLLLPVVILTPLTGVLMALHVGAPAMPVVATANKPIGLAPAIIAAAQQQDISAVISARKFRGGTVLVSGHDADGAKTVLVDGNGLATRLEGNNVIKQLHEGTWAGSWSGALNFLAAVLLTGLMVSGVVAWGRRHRRQKATALCHKDHLVTRRTL